VSSHPDHCEAKKLFNEVLPSNVASNSVGIDSMNATWGKLPACQLRMKQPMTIQFSPKVLFLVLIWLVAVELGQSQAQVARHKSEVGPDLLTISDGSHFKPKDHYPKFSWDTTPMYFMFGDTHRLLSPQEVDSIAARTDFLCIEKSHGRKPLGAAELGAKHEVAAFAS